MTAETVASAGLAAAKVTIDPPPKRNAVGYGDLLEVMKWVSDGLAEQYEAQRFS